MGLVDSRYHDFQDHLILRFITDYNRRTHFPLIYASTNSLFAVKDLKHLLKLPPGAPAIADIRLFSN